MKSGVVCVLQLKTTQPDGVILYSGTATGRDFLAVELFDGQVRYVYDVGDGARTLRVNLRYSVSDDRWHRVAIVRSKLPQVTALAFDVFIHQTGRTINKTNKYGNLKTTTT